MLNINESVIQALAKTLKITNITKISLTDNLKNDLGLDSMSSLVFLMNLEENIPGFIIDPDTLDMDALETVATITQYVKNQLTPNEREVA